MFFRRKNIHKQAAAVFFFLSLTGFFLGRSGLFWPFFPILSAGAALTAWTIGLFSRSNLPERADLKEDCPTSVTGLSDGQIKLIDSGLLPSRLHPDLDLNELEVSHFIVPAEWLSFEPMPDSLQKDLSQALIRYSGKRYFYILRPYELLLPARIRAAQDGEFIITNQRVIFISQDSCFEIPLAVIEHLDCSAFLIDFKAKERRYTIQTDAACYAEKIFNLLTQSQEELSF